MRASLKIPLQVLACCLLGTSAYAADAMGGAWTGWVCPQGGGKDVARCSSFTLQLLARNNRVCGSHLFATAGAREMDEGELPSLFATVDAELATGTVESGRGSSPMRLPVKLSREGDELHWQLVETPVGDYLLPASIRMKRARQGGLHPLAEQRLIAACAVFLDTPTDPVAPAPESTRR